MSCGARRPSVESCCFLLRSAFFCTLHCVGHVHALCARTRPRADRLSIASSSRCMGDRIQRPRPKYVGLCLRICIDEPSQLFVGLRVNIAAVTILFVARISLYEALTIRNNGEQQELTKMSNGLISDRSSVEDYKHESFNRYTR